MFGRRRGVLSVLLLIYILCLRQYISTSTIRKKSFLSRWQQQLSCNPLEMEPRRQLTCYTFFSCDSFFSCPSFCCSAASPFQLLIFFSGNSFFSCDLFVSCNSFLTHERQSRRFWLLKSSVLKIIIETYFFCNGHKNREL